MHLTVLEEGGSSPSNLVNYILMLVSKTVMLFAVNEDIVGSNPTRAVR